MQALLSIIKNKEFWLSNLKNVNDKEECKKIDVDEYKNSFFVGCFTYADDILDEHWKEYGTYDNGVLFSVKESWFNKSATFMTSSNQKMDEDGFRIFSSMQKAMEIKIEEQNLNNRIVHPYFIFDFNFYQIICDDNLVKNISGDGTLTIDDKILGMQTLVPYIGGLVKDTNGICSRWDCKPYYKDWTSEKEVRLKVGIDNVYYNMNNLPIIFPKIAVSLNEEAFKQFRLRFGPTVSQEQKKFFLEELKRLLPTSEIEVL